MRAEDGTDRTDLSDEVGDFLFDGLVAGEFSLIIEAQHFRSSLDLVKISSGERTTFNRKLMLDPKVILQEHVTVVGIPLEMLAIPGSAHRISGDTLEQRKISDTVWQECVAHVGGPAELVEMVVAIGNWTMFSQLLRSLEIPLEDGVEAWPPAGKMPVTVD